jgi:hypothetical protein
MNKNTDNNFISGLFLTENTNIKDLSSWLTYIAKKALKQLSYIMCKFSIIVLERRVSSLSLGIGSKDFSCSSKEKMEGGKGRLFWMNSRARTVTRLPRLFSGCWTAVELGD